MKIKRGGSSFNSLNSKRRLESVFLFATGKCNAKCVQCFYADDMAKKNEDLSFDEIRRLSETAGSVRRLWLSGGEPTLREDLPEIIEMFCKNNGVTDVNLPTNAIKTDRLIEWIARLRKSCPNANLTISVSMDGFGETHDRQRGVESFYTTAAALKKIDEHFGDDGRVLKNMATVVTKYNVAEVEDFVSWVYGRFNISTHTIEAARGSTREKGVKILTEKTMSGIQDRIAPFYLLYAKRIGEGMNFVGRGLAKFFYVGLYRAWFNMRVKNIDKPTCWGMDCTAGETSLVVDYDGRFRACEIREPVGNVKDYGCDVQAILSGAAMKKEIADIGHGYAANCWCTHGCWIMSSMNFNPGKMISMMIKGNRETRRLSKWRNVVPSETVLRGFEVKYKLDRERLEKIGIVKAAV